MWHCHTDKNKPKHDDDPNDHNLWLLTIILPDDRQFSLPIWSLFWLIGPLFWWGAASLQVIAVVILVALVLGVRVHLDDGGERNRKNDDLL